jgi:hypothetical protein
MTVCSATSSRAGFSFCSADHSCGILSNVTCHIDPHCVETFVLATAVVGTYLHDTEETGIELLRRKRDCWSGIGPDHAADKSFCLVRVLEKNFKASSDARENEIKSRSYRIFWLQESVTDDTLSKIEVVAQAPRDRRSAQNAERLLQIGSDLRSIVRFRRHSRRILK